MRQPKLIQPFHIQADIQFYGIWHPVVIVMVKDE